MITEEIKEFLKGNNQKQFIEDRNILKIKLKNKNGYALYEEIFNESYRYLFCIDHKHNLMHVNQENKSFIINKYIKENYSTSKYEDIIDIIKKINDQYINTMEKWNQYIKEELASFDESIYEEYQKQKTQQKEKIYKIGEHICSLGKKFKHSIDTQEKELDIDIISDVQANKLQTNIKDYINNKVFNEYVQYKVHFFAKEDYVNQTEKDPLIQRKKAIMELLTNDNYKSFRVTYIQPDNINKKEFKFNKSLKSYENVGTEVMKNDVLQFIPIIAIDKINYGKKVLYNNNDFEKIEYNKDDLAKAYAKSNDHREFYNVAKENPNNLDVIVELLAKNFYYLSHNIDKGLYSNFDFLKKLIGKIEPYYLVNIIDDFDSDIFINKDNVKELFLTIKAEKEFMKKRGWSNIFESLYKKIPKSLFKEEDLLKLMIELNVNKELINKIDVTKLTEEMFQIIKNNKRKELFFPIMPTKYDLLKIASKEELAIEISSFSENVLYDRDFLLDLVNNYKAKCLEYPIFMKKISSFYKDDDLFINTIAKAYIGNPEKFIEYFDLKNNREKIFELCSINATFIYALTNSELEIFIEAESLDIESVKCKNETIYYKVPFGNITVDKNGTYYFEDENDHKYKFFYKEPILINNIKNWLKENYGISHIQNHKKLVEQLEHIEKTKEINTER